MKYQYTQTYDVQFRDVDWTRQMTMNAVVDYMQQVAGEHAAKVDIDLFAEKTPIYWVVSRAKVHMTRYPKLGEKVRFVTYPAGVDKLFAIRKTDIYDQTDQQVGYTIAYYVLVDSKSGRPMRPAHLKELFGPFIFPYEDEILDKIKPDSEPTKEDFRKVRYGEIDVNNHMNNAHYVRWSLDMMSCEERQQKEVMSIQMNYLSPLVEGDEVKILRYNNNEGEIVITGISLDEKKTYWNSNIKIKNRIQ